MDIHHSGWKEFFIKKKNYQGKILTFPFHIGNDLVFVSEGNQLRLALALAAVKILEKPIIKLNNGDKTQ